MTAMVLGAFAVQYYTWTAPTQVSKLTNTTTFATTNEEVGAMHNGTENWGANPTASTAATAAETIATPGERIKLGFQVLGTTITGIEDNYSDLTVQVNLYIPGENLEVQTYNENLALTIVSDGTPADDSDYLDNATNGFEPNITLDAVVHLNENTQAVAADSTVSIPIDIWAEEV